MLPALIAGGTAASLLGRWWQNEQAQSAAQRQMDFQSAQADKAMAFSERMSSTAYQRSVADLKAAGLNPILAAGGMSDSAPSGVSSSGSSYQPESLAEEVSSTASQVALMSQQLAESKSREDLNRAEIESVGKQMDRTQAETDATNAQTFAQKQANDLFTKLLKSPQLAGVMHVLKQVFPGGIPLPSKKGRKREESAYPQLKKEWR